MSRLRNRYPTLLFWFGATLLLAVLIVPRVESAAFHPDETGWIVSGRAAFRRLQARHLGGSFWQSDKILGRKNPWLARTLFGAAVVGAGYRDQKLKSYDFALGVEENRARGAIPPPAMLRAARLVSAALGVLACLGVLLLGTLLASHRVGLLAALLLALNPIFALAAGQALVDVPALALGVLGLVAALLARRRLVAGRAALWPAALAGLALGAALSAKLNAGLALGAGLALLCSALICSRPLLPALRRVASALSGMLLCCACVVYASNPSLYRDPLGGLQAMLGFSSQIHRAHAGTNVYLATPWARLQQIFSGRLEDPLALIAGPAGAVVVLAVGLGLLFKRQRGALSVLGPWLLVVVGGLALWLPLPEPRYLLPLLPCLVLLQSLLLAEALLFMRALGQPRRVFAASAQLAALFSIWLFAPDALSHGYAGGRAGGDDER